MESRRSLFKLRNQQLFYQEIRRNQEMEWNLGEVKNRTILKEAAGPRPKAGHSILVAGLIIEVKDLTED